MFDSLSFKDARAIVYLKRIFAVGIVVFLIIGMISAYRAWFQVHSLELIISDRILRSGSTIQTNVVSYGRTFVTVRIELVQGGHSETVATQHVSKNSWGLFDPRIQHASQIVVLTPELLTRFDSGSAQLRATALGGPQWTRTPPPVVRELAIEIKRD